MLNARLVTILAAAGAVAPAAALAATKDPPPVRTPDDAVAAVKRIVVHNADRCDLDWTRIHALGYEGHWKVTLAIRGSAAGNGTGRWTIGDGYPVAANGLARAVAHGCSRR